MTMNFDLAATFVIEWFNTNIQTKYRQIWIKQKQSLQRDVSTLLVARAGSGKTSTT